MLKIIVLMVVGALPRAHAAEALTFESSTCMEALRFLVEYPHIPRENLDASFTNFYFGTPTQNRAYQMAWGLAEWQSRRYDALPSVGLLLSGPPGVGKTHLAVAIARKMHRQNFKVLFLSPATSFRRPVLAPIPIDGIKLPERLAQLRWENDRRAQTMEPVAEALERYDVVVMDDVNPGPHQTSYFHTLVEATQWAHNGTGKKLLVTSNLSSETLLQTIFKNRDGERARFADRFRSVFATYEISAPSARPSASWAREEIR